MTSGRRSAQPAINVVLAVALTVGFVGLLTGVEGTGREVARRDGAATEPATPATAGRSYLDMQARDYGPNRELPAQWFDAIRRPPDLFAPIAPTPADRAAALALRAARRAYEGAPPVIPHAVDQHAAPACAACHERGARIGELVAPVTSHPRRDSCLQCHVVAADPRHAPITPPAPQTEFAGLRSTPGERAWPGAPPTIPHATAMRERCASCHGPRAPLGLRTTHPWRASCLQCHAVSASRERPELSSNAGEPR